MIPPVGSGSLDSGVERFFTIFSSAILISRTEVDSWRGRTVHRSASESMEGVMSVSCSGSLQIGTLYSLASPVFVKMLINLKLRSPQKRKSEYKPNI